MNKYKCQDERRADKSCIELSRIHCLRYLNSSSGKPCGETEASISSRIVTSSIVCEGSYGKNDQVFLCGFFAETAKQKALQKRRGVSHHYELLCFSLGVSQLMKKGGDEQCEVLDVVDESA